MKNLDFTKLSLELAKDKVTFYREIREMATEDVINEIKRIQELKKSEVPVFYKYSNSGKSISLFNEAGEKISTVENLKGYDNLHVIYSENQVSRKIAMLLEKMKYEVAVRLRLPVFQNGNFYAETKKELLKLGIC